MKLLIIFFLILFVSCTPKTISSSFLKTAQDLGSKNQGINKIVYQNEELYVILFANGSKYGELSADESTKDFSDVLAEEISSCENLCKTNEGLADLEVNRTCPDSTTINMNSLCLKYENKVKCICKNKINQTLTRSIVLTEKEIQSRTKALESVIWVAPQ